MRSKAQANDSPVNGLPKFDLFEHAELKLLCARLKSTGFTEQTIHRRLQIPHVAAMSPSHYPVFLERLGRKPDGLSTLISLFLIQSQVTRKAANEALTSDVINGLLRAGLVRRGDPHAIAATVSIYPCCGYYFVTDHRFPPVSHDYCQTPDQPVMYLGPSSYALAYLAPQVRRRARLLDVCTGSGVHAILSSRKAKEVIGVDLNPRAIEFARFNATLNGVGPRCDFRYGSLYKPIQQADEHDRGFDLIVANPPFVPSPHIKKNRLLFRDGGSSGEEILKPVLEGALSMLKANGLAIVTSYFADQKRARAEVKIKKWIGSESPVDILMLKFYSIKPEELASWFTWRWFGDSFEAYTKRYKEWLDALKSEEITQLTNGVLAVRISPSGKSSFRTVNVPVPTRPAHDTINREFNRLMQVG